MCRCLDALCCRGETQAQKSARKRQNAQLNAKIREAEQLTEPARNTAKVVGVIGVGVFFLNPIAGGFLMVGSLAFWSGLKSSQTGSVSRVLSDHFSRRL